MSRMGHRCILRLGKTAVSYSNLCSSLHKGRELHISNVINNNKTGTDEATSSENTSDQTRASSSHQQYRRNSYERKRSNYQEDRDKQTGYNRTAPFVTTAPVNHYHRLNVEPSADTSAIKTAYYNLSKQYHPDIVGQDNPNAADDFRLLTESYDILCDPKSRAQYDSSIAPTQQAPIFTAWNPSKSATAEQDQIYRMREAGLIFRSRQEEALEREKLRNPQKFKAGTFKYDDDDDMYSGYQSNRLESKRMFLQHMRYTDNSRLFQNRTQDGSDFYRMHLYDSLMRRKEDLNFDREYASSQGGLDGDYTVIVALALVLGGLGVAGFAIAAIFDATVNVDIADYLDQTLETKVNEIKEKFKND